MVNNFNYVPTFSPHFLKKDHLRGTTLFILQKLFQKAVRARIVVNTVLGDAELLHEC